ncbi:MAG: GHKL domain-containing protein [Desulfobacteraceae bacterium]|nr:GHKL domain-containing protein [Desulfobacteraceae bacterium]
MIINTQKLTATHLQARINLIFFILAIALEGLMITYWIAVLEPQVMEKMSLAANRLAQSQTSLLIEALADVKGDIQNARIINALDKMLVLKDPDTGTLFTVGVEVKVNCNVVKSCDGEMKLNRGNSGCEECFVTEIPLYSESSKEFLGTAKLHNNNEFFLHFKKGVKSMFFTGAGVGLALIIFTCLAMNAVITKIKSAEKDVQVKQVQLVHTGRLTAMGEMATGIAHEINQPLSIIRIAADGLKAYFSRKDPGTMEEEAVHSIIRQVRRMASIIDNMRSFVRTSSDSPEPADISEPVRAALSFFKEQFRIHQITLTISLPDNLPKVRVNPQKFEQIVVNLLSNARYAVDKKREFWGKEYHKEVIVHLEHDAEKNTVVFEVRDNGIGMEQDVMNRCIDPFFTTKEVGEGTGIGLSIVNGIVREYKMEMEIESTEEQGSIFRLKIKT